MSESFNEKANSWDTPYRKKRAALIAQEIISKLDNKKDLNALEFGCGTGLISYELKDRFARITMLDNASEMVKLANEKFTNKYQKAIVFDIEKDILEYKYDVIYSSMVLHHIKDVKKCLRILKNALNKDGILVIVDLDYDKDNAFHSNVDNYDGHPGFKKDEFKQMMLDSGFKDIGIETFLKDTKIIKDKEITYSLFIISGKEDGYGF